MSQYRDLFEIQMQDNPIQLTVSHSDGILTITMSTKVTGLNLL